MTPERETAIRQRSKTYLALDRRRPHVMALDRAELLTVIDRLRDKLRELAGWCSQCNGTGIDTDYFDEHGREIPEGDPRRATGRPVTRPCEDCEDIRELL